MTKPKFQIIESDKRRFKLVCVEFWRPVIEWELTQLDLLRLRKICLRRNNLYYAKKFEKIIKIVDRYLKEETDFSRELPRKPVKRENV